MTDYRIVPAGGEQQMQVSAEAREAALAAAAGIETKKSGPYLYLAQHDSTAVTERQEGVGGDWIVAGLGDKVVNLGQNPLVIVVGHQVRFVQTRWDPQEGKNVVVFNLPWEHLNADQQAATELPWSDPNAAKPVDSFMLVHVTTDSFDPKGIKAFNYQPKPGSARDAAKWAADLKAVAHRNPPVAPFAALWQLGSHNAKYDINGRTVTKLAMTHKYATSVDPETSAWAKLKESWAAFEAMKRSEGGDHFAAQDDDTAALEAQADAEAQIEDGPADHLAQPRDTNAPVQVAPEGDYGQVGVGGYDDYAAPEKQPVPEPSMDTLPPVPKEAAKLGMNYTTPILVSKDADGNRVKAASIDMEHEQAKSAAALAMPYEAKVPEAKAVLELLRAVCDWRGWKPESLGFPPF